MENLFAIQIGNKTFLDWCDEKWYGSETLPLHKFTREQIPTIVKQLQSHFKYKVIAFNNNEKLFYEFGKEVNHEPTFRTVVYKTIDDDDNEPEVEPDIFQGLNW